MRWTKGFTLRAGRSPLARYLICLFCVCRSLKRSRRSWRTRPGYSVAWLEKSPVANWRHSRAIRLLCSGNSQLWANPASSRLWFNPCKVSRSQVHACIVTKRRFFFNVLMNFHILLSSMMIIATLESPHCNPVVYFTLGFCPLKSFISIRQRHIDSSLQNRSRKMY